MSTFNNVSMFADTYRFYLTIKVKKVMSFPSHMGRTDLRFYSPQPDTSSHYKATNTGPVYLAVCLFTPQLSPVPNYTAW